jgi:DNA-binding XRE family transcriptional regulator
MEKLVHRSDIERHDCGYEKTVAHRRSAQKRRQNPLAGTASMNVDAKLLAARMFRARRELNLTQADLSGEIGIGTHAISDFETGKRSPSLVNFCKIANALNVSPNDFLT